MVANAGEIDKTMAADRHRECRATVRSAPGSPFRSGARSPVRS